MTTPERRAVGRHFDRLYKRLDEVSSRVSKLERAYWIGTGSIGAIALFNLWSNVTGGGGG